MMYGITAHYKLITRFSFWYTPAHRAGRLHEFLEACVDRFHTDFPEPDDGDPPYLLAQRRAIKADFIHKDIVWASHSRRGVEPDITWEEAFALDAEQWEACLAALEKRHAAAPPRMPGYTDVAGHSYHNLSLMDKARVWRRLAEIKQKRGYTSSSRPSSSTSAAATKIDKRRRPKSKKLKVGDKTPNGVVLVVDSSDSEGEVEVTGFKKAEPIDPLICVYNSDGDEVGKAQRVPVYNSEGEEIDAVAGPLRVEG
ncbi:hypothetical protein CC1G_02417 [Coprinopsis cinerea okayama7|uniref:Uncharacterized protein n=1 Tax=Coprinopsis cinerea (strain Okayama-7 / 130 / ATCC MYA-4618 / FGSC 9003) TaxID=240176 RepID=A8NBF7_COPC7|nr:hypothetical protein CC1G_02417 [Coprinopsis cinerea okayama7\|eukprot:XP_001832155.2 hypothetical protein CC1G_02417 [Coprinopsis cinerea okayama7\